MAALDVLTFALVATFIPTNPANTENKAPKTKQTAVWIEWSPIAKINASTITKTTRALYSLVKNAIAPCEM